MPLTLRDDVVVADHFAVKQLIPLFTEDGRFYVLALSQKQVRFFVATRTGIQERAVPEMPKNIDDLRQFDETEERLHGHTIAPTPGHRRRHDNDPAQLRHDRGQGPVQGRRPAVRP